MTDKQRQARGGDSGQTENDARTSHVTVEELVAHTIANDFDESQFYLSGISERQMLSMFASNGATRSVQVKLGLVNANDLVSSSIVVAKDININAILCIRVSGVRKICSSILPSTKWESYSLNYKIPSVAMGSQEAILEIEGIGSGQVFLERIGALVYSDSQKRWHNPFSQISGDLSPKIFLANELNALPQPSSVFVFTQNNSAGAKVVPFLSAPTGSLVMNYPGNQQTLDLDGQIMAKVNPVAGASGYLFSIWQNNTMIWENLRDEKVLSMTGETALINTSLQHSQLVAGPAILMVRYIWSGKWSDALSINLNLVPDVWDVLGTGDLDANRILAQDPNPKCPGSGCIWPNYIAHATSDPWISQNHQAITRMSPRVLVINFANGIAPHGTDVVDGRPFTPQILKSLADQFIQQYSMATKSKASPTSASFINPQLLRVIDLRDSSPHANSALFPRGPKTSAGYPIVGYNKLFTDEYAPFWKIKLEGRYLNLKELIEKGVVHDVIMVANQVDAGKSSDPNQVTSNILEVAFVAQAYNSSFQKITGEYVRNGTPFERQKFIESEINQDIHNSMPWANRSARIFFLNPNAGINNLMHAYVHEIEYRFNESRVYAPNTVNHEKNVLPWVQPLFRKFAWFDYKTKFGATFDSLYAGGGGGYKYPVSAQGVRSLETPTMGSISNYYAGCGNAHYTPNSKEGYMYNNTIDQVLSFCDTFQKPGGTMALWTSYNNYSLAETLVGGQKLGWDGAHYVNWFQRMPGFQNDRFDFSGNAMKNWYVFFYY
jgi:hypothetical protein